jgi:hypothetical protein
MKKPLVMHYHNGTKIMGKTLCGTLVEFNKIEGNVFGYKSRFCKKCKKSRKVNQNEKCR